MSGPSSQTLSLKINGLYTNPNTFSEVPEGITLSQANDIVIDRDSIINSRRGFPQYGNTPGGATNIREVFDFKDTLILHDANGVLSYDTHGDGTSWTAFPGTYLAPGATSSDRIVSFQQNKNLYLATNNGIYKMASATSNPVEAGMPEGLGGSGVTTGSSGFMATATNVAYRIVWGYRDANDNLILGAPSDRVIVSNVSGADRNVQLTFFIPAQVDTTDFYQIYRSAGSADLATEPDDELQLVAQGSPTGTDITNGIISVLDSTPDDLRGTLIYTAASLTTGGILNANTQPPFAKAVATFQNYALYGNTRTKQSLETTLIAVGAPDGIQVGDTITFTITGGSSFSITGASTENAAAGQFKVDTSLTPAENIENTARSIVNVLNTVASNTLFAAYYVSGYQELPGHMQFTRLTLDPTSFYVNSARPSAFRPIGGVTGSTYDNTSRNEELQNRVYISKLQQPEAVPIENYFDIGSSEEPIYALVPLRDGVIVLKTDGVFRITTSGSSFAVNPLDLTVKIIAKHSVATLNNTVFFFSTQGVVAASDSGTVIKSRQIETELLQYSSSLFPNFNDVTFAQGYESDRKYILWMPTTSTDTQATQSYVLNTLTGDWTRWTKTATAAIVKQDDDKLYIAGPIANGTDQYVFQERKNFNVSDFADEQYTTTVTAALGLTLTVTSTANILEGYTLQQSLASGRVVSVNSPTSLTMDSVQQWAVGSPITAFRPIYQFFETNQLDGGNPGELKHWADCSAIFRATSFDTIDVGFNADTTNETKSLTLVSPPGTGGWGTFPWGTLPWGTSAAVRARLRMAVPKGAQRSNWLTITMTLNEAFTDISLAGVALTFTGMSSRQKGASRA